MPAFADLGEPIRLESQHFLLRSMEDADALLEWGDWTADPATARALNAMPRQLDLGERQRYVAGFDRRAKHLLGIWEKAGGALVGLWSLYVDDSAKEFLFNVLVGEHDARAKGALKETRDLIYEHFFNGRGMKAVRCTVVSTNEQMIAFLKRNHWVQAGASRREAASGGGTVEVLSFRLTRENWRKRFSE
jgi:RimJ/RimL family protein N-acetyltransferase